VLPVRIDGVEGPRTLIDLDHLDLQHRNPDLAARKIDEAIARRQARVRLFISHAHRDADLAERLLDFITASLEVPDRQLRCTSVPGHQLDLGTMAPEALRTELGSAGCIVALLTPNSLGNEWVLFELGAAWANARMFIPLLAGGLRERDIPGPFRGAAGGELASPMTLERLVEQVQRVLGWPSRRNSGERSRRSQELVDYAKRKTFPRDSPEAETKASFAAKRAWIGGTQGRLLDHLAKPSNTAPSAQEELSERLKLPPKELYYRLEQLRLLGFVTRVRLRETDDGPVWGWALSDPYRSEIAP
jgi:hypothetical protein